MKMKAAATSPFVHAGEGFEEAWVLWKSGRYGEKPAEAVAPEPLQPEPPLPPMPRPVYRHQQYDAVIRRMKNAQQQTGAYSPMPT